MLVKKNMICRSLSLVLALLTLLSCTFAFTSCGDDRSMGPTYMTIGGIDVPYDRDTVFRMLKITVPDAYRKMDVEN